MEETKVHKVLYVGAGSDLSPVYIYKRVKTFVFIDVSPSSYKDMPMKSYSSTFIPELIAGFSEDGFNVKPEIPDIQEPSQTKTPIKTPQQNLIYFFNVERNQEIYYYVNTSIPEDYDKISNIIKGFTILYISGFFPNKIVMRDVTPDNPILFAGIDDNIYKKEYVCDETKINGEDPENIIAELHINSHIQSCFSAFYSVRRTLVSNNELSLDFISHQAYNDDYKFVYTMTKYNTWDNFYDYYLRFIDDLIDM
jgi:hypothetical protein